MRLLRALVPRSIFAKTTLTLTLAFLVFAVLTLGSVIYYTLIPLARNSADDLAALMLLSAHSWVAMPPPAREDFSDRLYWNHSLRITQPSENLQPAAPFPVPYLDLVEQSLARRTGIELPLKTQMMDGKRWYWVDLSIGTHDLRIGFPRERIGTRPTQGLFAVVIITAVLILLTALVLARRITRPVRRLSEAAVDVARGQLPEPLPETGPEEVATLTQQFNHMAREVRELLANRTTLLAGISHDLRTPITRMRLSLEMLPEDVDPELVAGMRNDLEGMDRLIGQTLALSRDLESGRQESTDLIQLVGEVVSDARRGGAEIRWQPAEGPCEEEVNPTALRRILVNLMDNAARYGGQQPVDVALQCSETGVRVQIMDRGAGIPDEQREAVFRPFHRLEASRSRETGGSGLGLAVARQLAQVNGWSLELLEREGGGTEARLTLRPREG